MMNDRRLARFGKGKAIPFFLLAMFLAAILLAGCGGDASQGQMDKDSIKQLVHDLGTGKRQAASASITSTQLIVAGEDGKKEIYALPKDEFFVSIAPYLETTHPCANHSLTGCRGELPNVSFDLLVEDQEGNRIIDGTANTMANGFIDLWLPRNGKFRVTISRDGLTSVSYISTFEGDPTCITTMQLL